MHQRTSQLQVLVEVVLPVHTHHGIALHAVVSVRLQRHVHVCTCIDNALVQDGHLARRVVHRVVTALLQGHATSCHHHRTLGHVVGSQRDDIGTRSLELSCQDKFVFLCRLLGYGLRRVIQFVKHILVGHAAQSSLFQLAAQVVTERLCRGQEHATILNRIATDKVELPIGMGLHVIVQTVQSHHLQQRAVLDGLLRQVGQVDARCVALVLDIHFELGLLDRGSQVVHVLHHQVPVSLCRVVARVLQRFHEEHIVHCR